MLGLPESETQDLKAMAMKPSNMSIMEIHSDRMGILKKTLHMVFIKAKPAKELCTTNYHSIHQLVNYIKSCKKSLLTDSQDYEKKNTLFELFSTRTHEHKYKAKSFSFCETSYYST